ncbi:MAG: sulfoxide reductase heme-binding subunit YedZ [Chloroflexi bacterium]|nr:sulfoxide reductase heme-binding subunit YedZ [Chloroflexota bacterium]
MKLTRGQIFTHILCLLPLIFLAIGFFQNNLTANPIQALTLRSGHTAVNLLMLTLACRPLSNFFGLTALLKIRVVLGVYAFFYALFHFLVFAGLDFEFNLNWVWDEIRFKPFIQIGLTSLVLLIPLMITSIGRIRKNIGKSWQILHRLTYLAAALAVIHYLMASKGDFVIPAIYGVVLFLLFVFRLPPLKKLRIAKQPQWMANFNQFLLKT